MEHELKRQKMIVEAHSAVQQERLKADMNREIASLEVFEKRELEFQQAQEKERERAITAQQKLREIASQELQERIQLERELARQQLENVLLQKQNEIEKLEAQADKMLFQQKFENFVAAKETQAKEMDYNPNIGLPSPQSVSAEFSDTDTPPASQNKPKLARRAPAIVVDTDVVQEISTSGAMESMMPNISDDMDTQNICVSEAKASGMTIHASVMCVPPTYTQAAVHNDSYALGAPLSVANPGLGQGYYTAGIQPKISAHVPEPNTGLAVSSLSTGNVGLPFYSAYATPHLAPPVPAQPLMPHSAMGGRHCSDRHCSDMQYSSMALSHLRDYLIINF